MSARDFAIQARLFRAILRKQPSVEDGMKLVLDTLDERRPNPAWERVRGTKWERGLRPFERWLDAIVEHRPLIPRVRALWFDVPDILWNDAYTTVVGLDRPVPPAFDPGDEPGCVWEPRAGKGRGRAAAGDSLELGPLQQARRLLGLDSASVSVNERARLCPGVYAIQYSYVALLLIEALPRIAAKRLLTHHPVLAITMGYHDGDLEGVGALSRAGWAPLRRPTAAERRAQRARPEELDPNSLSFDIEKYLAAGLDVNVRLKDGSTLLIDQWTSDPSLIRRLLKAGADVNAVDGNGHSVLWHFAAVELPTVKALLAAGADATFRNGTEGGIFAACIGSGGSTAEHLLLLIAAGASPHYKSKAGRTAMHDLADQGVFERARKRHIPEMLGVLLDHGVELDAADNKGLTPLWLALSLHCAEVDNLQGWLRGTFKPEAGVSSFYEHHWVAMLLAKAGADVNRRLRRSPHVLIPDGATPLMCGRYDRPELHVTLLKLGADPNARCTKGKTPLDYARQVATDRRRPDQMGAAKVAAAMERAVKKNPKRWGR